MIDLKNISKSYFLDGRELKILRHINLKINQGEFISIIGASGSGKTTLLNLIGLLDAPTEGEYYLESKKIDSKTGDRALSRLRNSYFGFVFQTYNLLPRVTAGRNVELPLFYSRKKSLDNKAKKLLQLVGLEKRISHKPSQLSGGEAQRVAIARALVNDPKIILADEPTGNLDSATGRQIIDLLKKINQQGKTIILVTHDVDVAKGAGKIIKIKDGKIER
ncbi:MAG: ABC transporter [Candidatus Berkelbacteria bacterium Licking1014_2]|uniref:ABC transporter n=1 Tax=Candidatus Berkelbacteria bacterium Licking1014_2 TaxID=2017146 RepID=A0A554LWA2_9BACT|nr:MAG: ABC transporter [Candidatus Berkelbacteria bacterium Licking1014_2]